MACIKRVRAAEDALQSLPPLGREGGPAAEVLLDATYAKAHRCAAGEKGGSGNNRLAVRAAGGPTRSTPQRTAKVDPSASTSRVGRQPTSSRPSGQSTASRTVPSSSPIAPSTPIGSAPGSLNAAPRRTSRPKPIAAGNLASAQPSTDPATPSSACSAG
jgi:hypothetical protein